MPEARPIPGKAVLDEARASVFTESPQAKGEALPSSCHMIRLAAAMVFPRLTARNRLVLSVPVAEADAAPPVQYTAVRNWGATKVVLGQVL